MDGKPSPIRSGFAAALTVVGVIACGGGLLFALGALGSSSDASTDVFRAVFMWSGFVVAGGGAVLLAAGIWIGRSGQQRATATPATKRLSPEQQQMIDSREYQARQGKDGGKPH